MRMIVMLVVVCAVGANAADRAWGQTWGMTDGSAQHTALSAIGSQPLEAVHWSTPVDLNPQYQPDGGDLLIHYGSPVITSGNTVIVPVKTGASQGFELNAFNGSTGAELWSQSTDYTLPWKSWAAWDWTPEYAGAISGSTLYYAGNGGTVYERSGLDSAGAVTPTQVAFYPGGEASYEANVAAYNANVAISTPITADSQGDIYFGYTTSSSAPGGLTSGIAKISSTGWGHFLRRIS